MPAPPKGGAFGHLPVSADKAPPSGELANAVSLRGFFSLPSGANHPPQRRAFAESGAVNAVSLYDPSRENGFQESPQTFLKPEIINNSSAIDVQSAAEHILNRLVRWEAHFLRVPAVRFVWTSP